MQATVLVDNIGQAEMPGEWGLSIYIEMNGQRLLLDTGASALFRLWRVVPCTLRPRRRYGGFFPA